MSYFCYCFHLIEHVQTHLQQHMGDIDCDPVFTQKITFTTPDIHHPEFEIFARRGESKPTAARMRGMHVWPTTGGNVIAAGYSACVVIDIPVRKRLKERSLVVRSKPRYAASGTDTTRAKPQEVRVPVFLQVHTLKTCTIVITQAIEHIHNQLHGVGTVVGVRVFEPG